MQYDVLIIGAGVCGCAVAYSLSRYNLKVLVLEKENDVSMGTTKANSGIIHAGYDPETGTMMAKFNVCGSKEIEQLAKKLDVPYKKTGSLVIAFGDEDDATVKRLYERGIANGVSDLSLLTGEETLALEPNLNSAVTSSLLAKTAAVISPWELCFALVQVAVKNGATLSLSTTVTGISKEENGFKVTTDKGDFSSRFVINAAGVYADSIQQMISTRQFETTPSKGEYYLLDKSQGALVSHVIFQCPSKLGKGVLVAPTAHGNLIVGPNSEESLLNDTSTSLEGLEIVKQLSKKTIPNINFRDNIRNFAGVRANTNSTDFIFGEDPFEKGFFNMAGIKSPGLSSATAMAKELVSLLQKSGLSLDEKESYDDTRTSAHFAGKSHEQRAELIKQNPLYGRVICRCETITEGEIIDALNAPIPPVSLDGVKRRCGTGMGRCQGGFCSPKVHELLATAWNKDMADIPLDRNGSYILVEQTKGEVIV